MESRTNEDLTRLLNTPNRPGWVRIRITNPHHGGHGFILIYSSNYLEHTMSTGEAHHYIHRLRYDQYDAMMDAVRYGDGTYTPPPPPRNYRAHPVVEVLDEASAYELDAVVEFESKGHRDMRYVQVTRNAITGRVPSRVKTVRSFDTIDEALEWLRPPVVTYSDTTRHRAWGGCSLREVVAHHLGNLVSVSGVVPDHRLVVTATIQRVTVAKDEWRWSAAASRSTVRSAVFAAETGDTTVLPEAAKCAGSPMSAAQLVAAMGALSLTEATFAAWDGEVFRFTVAGMVKRAGRSIPAKEAFGSLQRPVDGL